VDDLLVYSSLAVVEVSPTQDHYNAAQGHESVAGDDCEWRFGIVGHRRHPECNPL
jgi:hypothetical protein